MKRAGGPTQAESARKNRQLLLRLPPEAVERLRAMADNAGMSVSAYVVTKLRLLPAR